MRGVVLRVGVSFLSIDLYFFEILLFTIIYLLRFCVVLFWGWGGCVFPVHCRWVICSALVWRRHQYHQRHPCQIFFMNIRIWKIFFMNIRIWKIFFMNIRLWATANMSYCVQSCNLKSPKLEEWRKRYCSISMVKLYEEKWKLLKV